jgi:hypothetical protein
MPNLSKTSRLFYDFAKGNLVIDGLRETIEQSIRSGDLNVAAGLARKAILYRPDFAIFSALLCNTLLEDGTLDAAVGAGRWATMARPDVPSYLAVLAFAEEASGRYVEALKIVEQIVGMSVEAQGDASLSRLLVSFLARHGRVGASWRLAHDIVLPLGRGPTSEAFASLLKDANGVLRVDLGNDFGGVIHHANFLAALAPECAVEVHCAIRLHALLARSYPTWRLVPTEVEPPQDILPGLALPHLTSPFLPKRGRKPSLVADPIRVKQMRRRLKEHFGDRTLVGMAWRSRPRQPVDRTRIGIQARIEDMLREQSPAFHPARSLWRKVMPISNFVTLAMRSDTAMISLQHDLTPHEVTYVRDHIGIPLEVTSIDFNGDLDNIATLIAALDAVISIPSTHADLAAALGRPTVMPVHNVPPFHGMSSSYAHYSFYPNLQLVKLPHSHRPDGHHNVGFSGDWRRVIHDAVMTVL